MFLITELTRLWAMLVQIKNTIVNYFQLQSRDEPKQTDNGVKVENFLQLYFFICMC